MFMFLSRGRSCVRVTRYINLQMTDSHVMALLLSAPDARLPKNNTAQV